MTDPNHALAYRAFAEAQNQYFTLPAKERGTPPKFDDFLTMVMKLDAKAKAVAAQLAEEAKKNAEAAASAAPAAAPQPAPEPAPPADPQHAEAPDFHDGRHED